MKVYYEARKYSKRGFVPLGYVDEENAREEDSFPASYFDWHNDYYETEEFPENNWKDFFTYYLMTWNNFDISKNTFVFKISEEIILINEKSIKQIKTLELIPMFPHIKEYIGKNIEYYNSIGKKIDNYINY